MTNIVYRQMPAPRELPQQIPWAKGRMEKPQGGGKFFVHIPECARGGGGEGGYGWNWYLDYAAAVFSLFSSTALEIGSPIIKLINRN